MLLVCDPEHLTAANLRKRHLCDVKDNLQGAVQYELWILDSLLTSPLKRHTKSPTLWSHRRFLYQRFPNLLNPDLELQTILQSAEKHPMNYYAFDYARRLTNLNTSSAQTVFSYCKVHVSDTSAWMFLLFLLINHCHDPIWEWTIIEETTNRCLKFNFKQESVWSFLRLALVSNRWRGLGEREHLLLTLEAVQNLHVANCLSWVQKQV